MRPCKPPHNEGPTVCRQCSRGSVGPIPLTPSADSECSAARQLHTSLRDLGNCLKIIHTTTCNQSHVSLMCEAVKKLQPQTVVVGANSSENCNDALELQTALAANPKICHIEVISVTQDGSLLPFALIPRALGRSRFGGRIVLLPTFLSNMSKHDA